MKKTIALMLMIMAMSLVVLSGCKSDKDDAAMEEDTMMEETTTDDDAMMEEDDGESSVGIPVSFTIGAAN